MTVVSISRRCIDKQEYNKCTYFSQQQPDPFAFCSWTNFQLGLAWAPWQQPILSFFRDLDRDPEDTILSATIWFSPWSNGFSVPRPRSSWATEISFELCIYPLDPVVFHEASRLLDNAPPATSLEVYHESPWWTYASPVWRTILYSGPNETRQSLWLSARPRFDSTLGYLDELLADSRGISPVSRYRRSPRGSRRQWQLGRRWTTTLAMQKQEPVQLDHWLWALWHRCPLVQQPTSLLLALLRFNYFVYSKPLITFSIHRFSHMKLTIPLGNLRNSPTRFVFTFGAFHPVVSTGILLNFLAARSLLQNSRPSR